VVILKNIIRLHKQFLQKLISPRHLWKVIDSNSFFSLHIFQVKNQSKRVFLVNMKKGTSQNWEHLQSFPHPSLITTLVAGRAD